MTAPARRSAATNRIGRARENLLRRTENLSTMVGHRLVDARIRPARWFTHASDARGLAELLASRARALECAHDARAPFCHAYALHIERLASALAGGEFGSTSGWIERLELDHAHQYLRAVDSFDRGELALVPAPWRAVFSLERQGHAADRSSIRLGTLVHIAYDLPLSLARSGVAGERPDEVASAYRRATALLADGAASIERETLRRYARPSRLGRLFARGHEGAIAALRERAWADGAALIETDTDADLDARVRVTSEIERRVLLEVRAQAGRAPVARPDAGRRTLATDR